MRVLVEEAIRRFQEGEILILVDDAAREDEGDFAVAADRASAESINFMITHGRGLVCVPITEKRARALQLLPMCPEVKDIGETRFTISVDARDGIATGISTHDRAETIRLLACASAKPEQLKRPGHVFPLIARDGGVLERAGHTEASVDLACMAGLTPAAVLCEILNEDGTMARGAKLEAVAKRHGLGILHIADLIDARRRTAR